MAWDMYWAMRPWEKTVVAYLTRFFPGSQTDAGFLYLYTLAQTVDTTLASVHGREGISGVCNALLHDNAVETAMNLLGCVWYAILDGDVEGAQSMLAVRPPNSANVFPKWAIVDAGASSKTAFQASERTRQGWGEVPAAVNAGPPIVNTTRQRRQAPPKKPGTPKKEPAAKKAAAPIVK